MKAIRYVFLCQITLIGFFLPTKTVHAQALVPAACVERFSEGGAVPGESSCRWDAALSSSDLGNYWCGVEEANNYCGPTQCPDGQLADYDTGICRDTEEDDDDPCPDGGLPDYETGECPVGGDTSGSDDEGDTTGSDEGDTSGSDEGDTAGSDDGGDTAGAGDEGDTAGTDDEGGTDGSDGDTAGADDTAGTDDMGTNPDDGGQVDVGGVTDSDEQEGSDTAGTDDEVEIIIGGGTGGGLGADECEGLLYYETGECSDTPEEGGLQQYDESQNTSQGSGSGCTETNADPVGALLFINQGLKFMDDFVVANAGTVAAGINMVAIAEAAQEAEETGNTTGLFNVIYDTVFPLLPKEGPLYDAFQDFADYVSPTGNSC